MYDAKGSGSARSENMGAGCLFASGERRSREPRGTRSSLVEPCRAGFDSFALAISLPGRLTKKGLLAVYAIVSGSQSQLITDYGRPNSGW